MSEIRHMSAEAGSPARTDYASFADFADSDGNTWVLQERAFAGG